MSVTDWRRSLAFYQSLGFEILHQRPDEEFACLALGDAVLMIDRIGIGRDFHGDLTGNLGAGMNLQIDVHDLAAVLAHMAQASIVDVIPEKIKWYRVGAQEKGNHQVVVADPDGYLLRFFENLGLR